jgi:hypothetical protein
VATSYLARYRCAVDMQVPVTLENVTSGQRSMFFLGSSNTIAWSMLAIAAMALHGQAQAHRLEGKTVQVPASGEATLADDRVVLRLVIAPTAAGVQLRADANARSVNLEFPYRVIRRFGQDGDKVYLDIAGRGPLWLHPRDRGEFHQWLAHLSYNKMWEPPTPIVIQAESPVLGWCQQDPTFTFGLPERWGSPPPRALADYGREMLPSLLRAGVGLDAGEWEGQMFVIDNGSLQAAGRQANAESLAAMMAEVTAISPFGPIQQTTIGGDEAVLLRGTSQTPTGVFDRCYCFFGHGDTLYALMYGVVGGQLGDGSYERWLPHFHTMIATWHWYR